MSQFVTINGKEYDIKITVLHLLKNKKILKLPAEIGLLTQLTYLNIGLSRLSVLPKEIGHMTQLTYL